MNDLPEFDNTHNKQSLDEARFLNLASGLLSSYSGTRVREILVGSSPKEWPPDVPILEGSQVIGSLVRGLDLAWRAPATTLISPSYQPLPFRQMMCWIDTMNSSCQWAGVRTIWRKSEEGFPAAPPHRSSSTSRALKDCDPGESPQSRRYGR